MYGFCMENEKDNKWNMRGKLVIIGGYRSLYRVCRADIGIHRDKGIMENQSGTSQEK